MKKFIHWILLLLLFFNTSYLFAQGQKLKDDVGFLPTDGDALAGSVRTELDTSIWDKIDLASARMKPRNKKFPWWIPATVGGVGVVTGVILLIDEDDDPITPPVPVAINDFYFLDCAEIFTAFPLSNDIGEGIRIVSVSGAPEGSVTFTDSTVTISTIFFSQDQALTYVIEDRRGQRTSALISVQLFFPNLNVGDRERSLEAGQTISGHLFIGNDVQCEGCTILSVQSEPEATIQWSPGGEYSFTAGESAQQIKFTFVIRDRCNRETTARLTITVTQPCVIEPVIEVVHEDCNLSNGSISVEILNADAYQYEWSNGESSASLQSLQAGLYSLTVTSNEDPECSRVFEVEVISENLPFELQDEDYVSDVGVQITGNVLDNDVGTGMVVIGYTPIANVSLEIDPDGTFTFEARPEAEEASESVYTVRDTCGDHKEATIRFSVNLMPCDFTATVSTNPADCGKANGSASLFVFPPDGNYLIIWPDGSSGSAVSGLETGTYNLQVTDLDDNCQRVIIFTIEENPPFNYGDILSVEPSSCLDDGVINLNLQNQMGGVLNILIEKNGESFGAFESSPGLFELSEQFDISPGEYTISIIESDCPPRCAQVINVTIEESELTLLINDDSYTIPANTKWNGNVLNNDEGTGLTVLSNTEPDSGMLMLDADGTGMYMPDDGFTGQVTFEYTVVDTCGNTATAMVTIMVEESPCDFTASVTTTPSDCGKANGTASIAVEPPGMYLILWPNGNIGESASGLEPGSYVVLVEQPGTGCSIGFPFEILENPPGTYVTMLEGQPATCLGGGEILITLFNPMGNAMNLEITFNGEPLTNLTLGSGTHQLSNFTTIFPGSYTINVYDVDCPPRCGQTVNVVVVQDQLPIQANDDNYTIEWNGFWEGNVLTNDQGTGLQVISFTQPSEGNANINPNGDGFFVPEEDFSGTVTFTYTARDTCGQTQTATVTIIVENPPCEYTVSFDVNPAGCGLNNGSALITHFPNDPVEFTWSNGQTGPLLSNVPTGVYFVSLLNPQTGCELEFEVFIPEDPANYILSEEQVPPSCNAPGNLILELSGSGLFTILITDPNGNTTQLVVPNGFFNLSSYVDLFPGNWLLIIIDDLAGPDCALSYFYTLEAYLPPLIELADIIPPSSPSANDGALFIMVDGGTEPYIILVNGTSYGPFESGIAEITGLSEGDYEITAFDTLECQSNTIFVLLQSFNGGGTSMIHNENPISGQAQLIRFADIYSDPGNWTHKGLPENSSIIRNLHPSTWMNAFVGGSWTDKHGFGLRMMFGKSSGNWLNQNPGHTGGWNAHHLTGLFGKTWQFREMGFMIHSGASLDYLQAYLNTGPVSNQLEALVPSLVFSPGIQKQLGVMGSVSFRVNAILNRHSNGFLINSELGFMSRF